MSLSPVETLRPLALLTLVGALPLWWWQRRTLATLTPRRRRLSLALRVGLLALVALALAEPRLLQPKHATHVFWMVDRSHSVGEGTLQTAERFTSPEARHGAKGDSEGWIAFAGKPVPVGNF